MYAIICIFDFMNFIKFIKFKPIIKFKKFELHNYAVTLTTRSCICTVVTTT